MSDLGHETSKPADWRAERRDERRDWRGEHGWVGPLVGAAILIGLGIIFLLQNLGTQLPENWWGLFFLIPAIGSWGAAWRGYETNGNQLTGAVVGPFIVGVIFALLAVAFYMHLDWGIFWPVILILIGIGVLVRALRPR